MRMAPSRRMTSPFSIGFSTIQSYTGTPKSLQEGLYKRSIQALDNAKTKGNQIEYIQQN